MMKKGRNGRTKKDGGRGKGARGEGKDGERRGKREEVKREGMGREVREKKNDIEGHGRGFGGREGGRWW